MLSAHERRAVGRGEEREADRDDHEGDRDHDLPGPPREAERRKAKGKRAAGAARSSKRRPSGTTRATTTAATNPTSAGSSRSTMPVAPRGEERLGVGGASGERDGDHGRGAERGHVER